MNQIVHTPTQFIHYMLFLNHVIMFALKKRYSEIIESESDYVESISNYKYWSDSETRVLLSFHADNFDLYRKNKLKFYAKLQSKSVMIGLVLKLI